MSWSASPAYLKKASKIAGFAKQIGGYNELIRLERELREIQRQGLKPAVVQDSQGIYRVIVKPE
jgi:hypothetical protein